jgi:hypothetical protein
VDRSCLRAESERDGEFEAEEKNNNNNNNNRRGALCCENLSMEDVRSFIATHDLPLINKTNFRVCFLSEKTSIIVPNTASCRRESKLKRFLCNNKKSRTRQKIGK